MQLRNLNRPSAVAPVSAAATRTFNKVSSNFGKLRRPTSAKISKEKHLCISLKKASLSDASVTISDGKNGKYDSTGDKH